MKPAKETGGRCKRSLASLQQLFNDGALRTCPRSGCHGVGEDGKKCGRQKPGTQPSEKKTCNGVFKQGDLVSEAAALRLGLKTQTAEVQESG